MRWRGYKGFVVLVVVAAASHAARAPCRMTLRLLGVRGPGWGSGMPRGLEAVTGRAARLPGFPAFCPSSPAIFRVLHDRLINLYILLIFLQFDEIII